MNKNFKCSVVIPVYNAERFIENCLRSVMNQTIKDIEIICVNDCSKDKSREIIEKLQKEDNRIRLINNETNQKVSKTRNIGIKNSNSDLIALLDADDMWLETFLEKTIEKKEKSGAKMVISSETFMTDDGKRIDYNFIIKKDPLTYKDLLKQNKISCSAVLAEKQLLLDNPFFADEVHEDYLCWLNILKQIKQIATLQDVLSIRRLTVGSKSRNKVKAIKMSYSTYRKHGLNPISSLFYTFCNAINGIKKYSNVNKGKNK